MKRNTKLAKWMQQAVILNMECMIANNKLFKILQELEDDLKTTYYNDGGN